MAKKRLFVALHTVILHDPDIGQEKYVAGKVIKSLTDDKEIARLLKNRAIREIDSGEAKGDTASLVKGIDDGDLVGDKTDLSNQVPKPELEEEEEAADGSELTVAQLKEWLTEAEVEFLPTAKKAELVELYNANAAK